jgi:serine/threonine protein kinase
MDKMDCIKNKAVRNLFRERIILEHLYNEFVLNLKYALQDKEHLFFIMDWARGGDLEFNLKRCKTFDSNIVRMFAAELSCALAYIHSKEIIHRYIVHNTVI